MQYMKANERIIIGALFECENEQEAAEVLNCFEVTDFNERAELLRKTMSVRTFDLPKDPETYYKSMLSMFMFSNKIWKNNVKLTRVKEYVNAVF